MVQKIGIVQNKAVISITAFLDKCSGYQIGNTGAFGKRYEAFSGAVRVFVVPVCSRERPDILSERFAELVLVFKNNSRLKSQQRFVVPLAPQSMDRAQRIVVLKVVPIDRCRIEEGIFISTRYWNQLFPLGARFVVIAQLGL